MKTRRITRSVVRLGLFVGLLSLAPVALSPSGGIEENRACAAGGQCVFELGSVCLGDGEVLYDYYFKRTVQ